MKVPYKCVVFRLGSQVGDALDHKTTFHLLARRASVSDHARLRRRCPLKASRGPRTCVCSNLNALGVMQSSVELRGGHKLSGLHGAAPRPLRLRQQTPLTCQAQTRSTSKGSNVAMRELPLPGSKTAEPKTSPTQVYVSKPATQQVSNEKRNGTWASARQDAARRNSNLEASTSTSQDAVSFEPYQQSSIVRANGTARNGSLRTLDAKTYDVTTSINQAAPGFTTASLLASASTDQRARSLIAEAESQSR